MRPRSALAGILAGLTMGVGAVAAIDAATPAADARAKDAVTRADLDAANARSIRAIKQATTAWNLVGRHVAPDGQRISANGPRVSQQKGTGSGIPTGLLADDAVTEEKLAPEVRARLGAGGTRGPAGPQGPPGPAGSGGQAPQSTAPSGPAGGALTGSYPDPELAERSVGPDQLAPPIAARVVGRGEALLAGRLTRLPLALPGAEGFLEGLTLDPTGRALIAPKAGIYRLHASVTFTANSSGDRMVAFGVRSGGTLRAYEATRVANPGATSPVVPADDLVHVPEEGAALEVHVSQSSGVALAARAVSFSAEYVGPIDV